MCAAGAQRDYRLEFLVRLDTNMDGAAGAVDDNGHSSGVPFRGTCQPFPASDIILSGSELFILFSGWNALTAKVLFKIRNGDYKSVLLLSIPLFFPASREPFQGVSFPQ